MLRPAETTQKLLLSSPAQFIAEYETADYVVIHAWRLGHRGSDERSPLRRTFFIISFVTPELEKAPGVRIPDYAPTGELTAALMAVLYGKRFDHHGPVEMTGLNHVPNLKSADDLCGVDEPYYSNKVRADCPVPLDLRELRRLRTILEAPPSDPHLSDAFKTAALFYARALRTNDQDTEVAYLHLITALERLSEAAQLDGIDLDAQVRTALNRVERELEDGPRVARLFRSRMRQVKRRLTALIASQLDDTFFTRAEAHIEWAALKANSFPRAAAAVTISEADTFTQERTLAAGSPRGTEIGSDK